MGMPLATWDREVAPHLNFIVAGAEMAARHARSLPVKPDFDSNAQHALVEARKTLEAALANIAAAESTYASKPAEHSHAG